MANPYAQYANPYAGFRTAGTGPKAPSGFRATDNGALAAIAGGPDDISYASRKAAAEAAARSGVETAAQLKLLGARAAQEVATHQQLQAIDNGGAGSLDPSTITYYAQQVLAGAPMPSIGMGKQAAAARQAIMQEVARQGGAAGLNGADQARQLAHYKAGTGQIANLEKMAGTIGVNEQTAMANGQQYLDRSAELPGQTPFAPLNALSNFAQRHLGGTTISAADAAYNTFTNEYAKVVAGSPTGAGTLSDSARHEAMSTISGSGSVAQKQAAFDQMKTDMANRMTAIHGGINNAYKALTNQPGYEVPDATQGLAVPRVAPLGGGALPYGSPPNPGGSGGPGGNETSLATGATRTEQDPKLAAMIEGMIRRGHGADEINTTLKDLGANSTVTQDQVAKTQNYLKGHPNYSGFVKADKTIPNSMLSQVAASPLGAGMASFADSIVPAGAFGQQAKDNLAALKAAHPDASLMGDVAGIGAGALAAGGVGAGLGSLAGQTGGMAARVLANPLTADALYGGAYGAAADPNNRFLGGLLGAGGGAALGAGARAIAGTAPVAAASNKIAGMFGRGIAPAPALAPAEAGILGVADKAGIPAIQQQLGGAASLGVPMSLADTSAPMTSLAGSVVRRSPSAAQVAENALLPRARAQIDRLQSAVTRDLGPVANIPQTSADLTQQARTTAAPLYDAAYAAPGASSVDLSDLAQRPSMKAGINKAYNIAQEEGRDPTALGFNLTDQGEVTLGRVPSFQTLDYVKRGLDETLEPHRNPITGKLDLNETTRAINGTKAELLKRTDAVNPDYAAARAAYSGPVQARDALGRGQDAFSLSPDELKMQAGSQTPEQLAQMQLGYRSELMNRANNVRDVSNPFEATLGTPNARARVDALYPGNSGNANLFATRDMEGGLARTQNSILGNSMTAQRQLADQSFAGGNLPSLAADAGLMAMGQVPVATIARSLGTGALRDAYTLGIGKRAAAKADAMAPTLFDTDPNAAAQALSDLLAKRHAYGQYIDNAAPRRLGGMFGAGIGAGLGAGTAGLFQ